jgi:AcrR family transcriptional regulator
VKTKKSDDTRARILDAALELFRSKGFEATTMRDVANAARVATGAAYYYFESKDAIVLAFYDRARLEMEPRLVEALYGELAARIRALIEVKLDYFAPSRVLLGALSGHTNPEHPLSPFSDRTREIREHDIAFFARAMEGSRATVPEDLRTRLPRLLWLYQMGIILFWIYDKSPEQTVTRSLLEKSVTLIVRLIRLSANPLLGPLRRQAVDLIDLASGGT